MKARSLNHWTFALALLVAACATALHPLSQQLADGYLIAAEYARRTDRLIAAQAITKVQAQQRHDNAEKARVALDTARGALAACRTAGTPDAGCSGAQGGLAAAKALLNETEAILIDSGERKPQ